MASGVDPFSLLAAIVYAIFRMVHALMPGHGKTVIVSYYLGRPARFLSSVGTSAILVLTHVGSAVVLVLAGFIVIRRTIGGAGRAPAFEIASAVLVIGIGLWLLFRAWRPHDYVATDGRVLAFVTGLVPCPLTTFVMVYASTQGIIIAGLLVTAGMAFGMTVTIALFALAAACCDGHGCDERTDTLRDKLGRGLAYVVHLEVAPDHAVDPAHAGGNSSGRRFSHERPSSSARPPGEHAHAGDMAIPGTVIHRFDKQPGLWAIKWSFVGPHHATLQLLSYSRAVSRYR